jgi:hypothetical protein
MRATASLMDELIMASTWWQDYQTFFSSPLTAGKISYSVGPWQAFSF